MGAVLSGSVVGCVSNSEDTPNESDTNGDATTSDGNEDETELTGYIRPDGEPETVPTDLTCPDESFTRFPTRYDEVRWGDTDKLSFRVTDDAIEHGDTVRATLRSTDYVSMGTEQQVQVELYTEEGWKEVRGRSGEEAFEFTDLGAELPPNEEFEWEFPFAEAGIVNEFYTELDLEVCPALSAGRYRLVFSGYEPAPAVAFDVGR
jgi:hypothetical protein